MSRVLRRVLIQNFEAAQASAAEPTDMDWEPTPQEDLLPQPAPEASHQRDQPGVSQATVPVDDVKEDTYVQHLPICPPNPLPFVQEPIPERLQIYPHPDFVKPRRRTLPKPLLSGPQPHLVNVYRCPTVTRNSLVDQLTSKKRRSGSLLPPISNRQAYFRNVAEPARTWYMRTQAQDIALQRPMVGLRNQSTTRRSNNPYPYTPSRSDPQSMTSPNSRKRRIEAVDGYAHNEHRASHDGQGGMHYHKQQARALITDIPESPIDTSMVDAPPYESSLLQSPVQGRTENDISQIQRTAQHMPGNWPATPVSVSQIAIPPTEIFHLSEADVGYIRDQVALMSGALAEHRRTSNQGMVVPLSDGNVIPPTSPEHAYELQQRFSYLQDISQEVSSAYYPILRASRFAIEAVGNRVRRIYRESVQAAVEVVGSAKRRAVAIYDKVTPEFVQRKINREQQNTRNLRRASSTERHQLKARKLGLCQRKQGSSSPQVTIDEYEDVTPPRPPRDMPASDMIDYFRLPREKSPTRTLTTTATKDGISKSAKVKQKLCDRAKSKVKTSRKFAQLSQEDVNKVALPRAPRRGELIKGAWPNAIPRSAAALRAYHESFAKLRSRPIEEMSGMYVPEPENWAPRSQPPPATPRSPRLPTEFLPSAEELTCQPEASVEAEEPEPPEEGLSPSSPAYEGFLTSPPRSQREAKEVHWLESDSPMGRPISSVRAYDPFSRVTLFQPHESVTAEESGHPVPEPMDKETSVDQSVQHDKLLLRSPEVPYVKHLTANWEAKVDRAMALSDKSEVGTTPRGEPLTRKALSTCYTKLEWLNDEVINAYLELIVDHARQEAGNSGRHDKPKYHAFSTYFFSNLRDKGYESVRRWATRAKIGGEKLLGVEAVFVPIHDRSHWTLMVVRPAARTIEHFDSLGSPSLGHIATAKEWLRGELGDRFVEEEWRVLPSISPQQNNGSDCGVFLLTTAKLVSLGKPLKYGARDIPEIRKRIVAELMNGGFFGDFDPKKDEMFPVRSML
ncbi:hypothetical protein ACJ73_00134 [Blastomyces percursus]|uniref:Ubiquitin-like protease family profile domain-containing protein n=1 Tax=Blastomyces percursus TaxID=1658174 RepID=A0A1J9RIT7_9EURO|nr:hypothetical protein ACJ73_00134 [Blastomyces percursus]